MWPLRLRQTLALGLVLLTSNSGQLAGADPSVSLAPLTLADFEKLALVHNPTLAQAAAQIEASQGKAEQAGLYPNPTVGYVGDQIGIQGTAGEMQGAFLQQTIITAGKLRLSRAKYSQEAREAELQALAQQLRVANSVRLQFYEVLAQQQLLALRQELLANAAESLRTHKEMFNTGQANRAEVLLVEVENNRAKVAVRSAENRLRAAWQRLTSLTGCPEMPQALISGSLTPDEPPLEWKCSLAGLLRDSPELHAAQAHVVHDQVAVRREQVEPVPDVCIQASAGYNFETSNTVAGVQIGLRLPLWDRNQGTIRQARADLARSQAEVGRLELALRQQLAEVFSRYETALESVTTFRGSSLPQTIEAYEIQREMYERRRAPWPAVVKLQRLVLDTKLDYLEAQLELRRAEVTIRGLLLVDGLSQPAAPTPGGHIEATPKPR